MRSIATIVRTLFWPVVYATAACILPSSQRSKHPCILVVSAPTSVTKLEDANFVVSAAELARGRTLASVKEIEESRPKKRMDELLMKAAVASPAASKSRTLSLRFLLGPSEILPAATSSSSVGAVKCDVTQLVGEANAQRAEASGEVEVIPAGMVLKSIGYRSVPVDPSLPWDDRRSVVRNEGGRVVTNASGAPAAPVPGLYVAGWLKRGPSGIIGTNIPDARETVGALLEDASAGRLPPLQVPEAAGGLDGVLPLLRSRGRTDADLVSWEGYAAIDAEERSRGTATGKPREKFTDVSEMLRAAAAASRKA